MHHHAIRMGVFIQSAQVGQPLQLCVGIHLASHDAGIGQYQKTVDEHFAATVKAAGERLNAAFAVDQVCQLLMFNSASRLRQVSLSACLANSAPVSASPIEPMPICSVPPSRTSVLACRPIKWS